MAAAAPLPLHVSTSHSAPDLFPQSMVSHHDGIPVCSIPCSFLKGFNMVQTDTPPEPHLLLTADQAARLARYSW